MEQIKKQGLAKSIGVSNYLPEHLEEIFEICEIPCDQSDRVPPLSAASRATRVPQEEGEQMLYHVSLGLLTPPQGIATAAYAPLTAATKAAPGPVDDIYAALSKKYAVSPGEISLRWCIDQDIVPITTSSKYQRLSDYLRCMTFKLTPAEIKDVSAMSPTTVTSVFANINAWQINEAGSKKHFRGFWNDVFEDNDRR